MRKAVRDLTIALVMQAVGFIGALSLPAMLTKAFFIVALIGLVWAAWAVVSYCLARSMGWLIGVAAAAAQLLFPFGVIQLVLLRSKGLRLLAQFDQEHAQQEAQRRLEDMQEREIQAKQLARQQAALKAAADRTEPPSTATSAAGATPLAAASYDATSHAPAAEAALQKVAEAVSRALKSPVRGYSTFDFGRDQDHQCRSVLVPKAKALNVVLGLRPKLPAQTGIFVGNDRWLGDEVHDEQVELVLHRTLSRWDPVRLARTSPVNHDMNAEDVIAKLMQLDTQYGVEVYGATVESVLIKIARMPTHLAPLMDEIMALCFDFEHMVGREGVQKMLEQGDGWIELYWS